MSFRRCVLPCLFFLCPLLFFLCNTSFAKPTIPRQAIQQEAQRQTADWYMWGGFPWKSSQRVRIYDSAQLPWPPSETLIYLEKGLQTQVLRNR